MKSIEEQIKIIAKVISKTERNKQKIIANWVLNIKE